MNVSTRQDMIEICQILAREENLEVTVKESAKGALWTALGVFVGGLVGGPVGMAVGGTVTSVTVAVKARGKFKSVVEVINEMSEDQKRRLAQKVEQALKNIRPEDCISLLTLVLTSASAKEAVLKEIRMFLMKEFQMKMIQ